MFRSSVSLVLSLFLATGQVIGQTPTTGSRLPTRSADMLSDEELSHYVGLEGQRRRSDSVSASFATETLVSRAERKNDGYAAYLVGCEEEHPTNSAWKPNIANALWWYQLGSRLGNPAAAYIFGWYTVHGDGWAAA